MKTQLHLLECSDDDGTPNTKDNEMTNENGYVMTELDLKARSKGFNYKMFPIDSKFDPMYARDVRDIETIEEMFSGVLFEYVTIGMNCPLVADYWR